MYLASGNRVVALRPETGEEIWRHELAEGLASFRGVAYGPATDDHEARIYFTSLSKVVALQAATGERDAAFGDGGEAAVRIPYTGVPVVYDETLILGSSAFGPGQRHIAPHLNQPRGGGEPARAWPRALDASGTLLWEFPTLPTESDFGSETWGNQSWRDRIGNNVWAFTLTVDEERGLVYMPVSSPGSNFYGGDRPGDNLFANSTIAIDIATGELAWYFQNIHRELWDYNLPPSPGLMDIERDGEVIPALAQVGKSGWMFILNRVTGEPVHGVEERPVPVGDVPGEQYSPTPAVPARAAPGVAGQHRPRRHRHRRRHHPRARRRLPRAVGHRRLLQRRTLYAHPLPAGRHPAVARVSRDRRRRELERHRLRSRARLHLRQLEGPSRSAAG